MVKRHAINDSGLISVFPVIVAGSSYAAGLDFEDVVDSALELARLAELGGIE